MAKLSDKNLYRMLAKGKRHRWKKGRTYSTCHCGARYRLGMVTKCYEFPDGTRSLYAGPCDRHPSREGSSHD
jgi:hypothetical protein